MKRITYTTKNLFLPLLGKSNLLTLIAMLVFSSVTCAYGMTFKSIEAGDYNDCNIWSGNCAPDRILFYDTVVISHDVELTQDLVIEGVLIVEDDAIFYGSYSIQVEEGGIIINDGVIDLQMEENPVYFIPNSFSPNSDEYNNSFTPVFVSGFEPNDYNLTIFNRNGKVIFESKDANFGWDGSYKENGIVLHGTYLWKIEFKETMSAKRHRILGHVNVVL